MRNAIATAAREAARAVRALRTVGRQPVAAAVEPAPTYILHPNVCRALDVAVVQERAGADERQPRVVVSVPGSAPFLAGDSTSTAEALSARFPKELASPTSAQVAERYLTAVVRERARTRRRAARKATAFAHNWSDL